MNVLVLHPELGGRAGCSPHRSASYSKMCPWFGVTVGRVIGTAGPRLPVAHLHREHITFSSGLCLNTSSRRSWDARQSNRAVCGEPRAVPGTAGALDGTPAVAPAAPRRARDTGRAGRLCCSLQRALGQRRENRDTTVQPGHTVLPFPGADVPCYSSAVIP